MSRLANLIVWSAALLLVIIVNLALPVQTHTQPASANEALTECPPPTSKGVYFERGTDQDGNVICGFQYYNECPYYSGAEAGTPECDKAKPTKEQLKPWKPNTPRSQPAQGGGK
jgi:hypothetical protein